MKNTKGMTLIEVIISMSYTVLFLEISTFSKGLSNF